MAGSRLLTNQALIAQGALMGLASGVTCLASCAPVLLPVMASCRGRTRGQVSLLLEYLAGRLGGYLLFAVFAWLGGRCFLGPGRENPWFRGGVDLGLALLLFATFFLHARSSAAQERPGEPFPSRGSASCLVSPWRVSRRLRGYPRLIPATLGFFSGLNLCPPFVAALAKAGVSEDLAGSLLFFAAFFAATALFFFPLPLVAPLYRRLGAGQVARFSCLLVGLYLTYTGLAETLLFLAPS